MALVHDRLLSEQEPIDARQEQIRGRRGVDDDALWSRDRALAAEVGDDRVAPLAERSTSLALEPGTVAPPLDRRERALEGGQAMALVGRLPVLGRS